MKRTLTILLATLAVAVGLNAQTLNLTNPPAPPTGQSLPTQVLGYFTSFNTNLYSTFHDNRFALWTGADSVQGGTIPLVNELGLSYDIWRPTPAVNSATSTVIELECVSRNGGVGGTLVSDQVGAGFSVLIWDVRATVYGDAGYDFTRASTHDKFFGEAGLRVWKALGDHFFGGVGMAARFPTQEQVFSAFAGATF